MKCYFCNSIKENILPADNGLLFLNCMTCYKKFQLSEAPLTVIKYPNILTVHLYQDFGGKSYHIQGDLRTNSTSVLLHLFHGTQYIARFSGIPLTPANIKHKLPTILTFL